MYLAIFPLLDSLLHDAKRVFGLNSRLDHLLVYRPNLHHQIFLQICIFFLQFRGSAQGRLRGVDRLMALIRVTSSQNRGVQAFELSDESMLVGQDRRPRVTPCFRGVNDLLRCQST